MNLIEKYKDEYLNYCRYSRRLLPNTIKAYQQDLCSFIDFCQIQVVDKIDANTLHGFTEHLLKAKGEKARSVKRRVACLKAFFHWARLNKKVACSPFEDAEITIRVPKSLPKCISKRELRILTRATFPDTEDLKQLARQKPDDIELTTYTAIFLMTSTGIRVGELVKIRLSDLSVEEGSIRIQGKGARERNVYVTNKSLLNVLSAMVVSISRTASQESVLFKNSRGSNLTEQALRLRLKKLSEESLKKKVTPHALRHTAATFLINEGVDIRFVQKLLGHASINTTEIYTHVSDMNLKKALRRVDIIGAMQSGRSSMDN